MENRRKRSQEELDQVGRGLDGRLQEVLLRAYRKRISKSLEKSPVTSNVLFLIGQVFWSERSCFVDRILNTVQIPLIPKGLS